MSRWFRLDDDVINDPKILLLPEAMRWIWVAFLCIASKNGGILPKIEIIALSLRVRTTKAAEYLTRLVTAGLIDKTETGFAPHNWNARQFKSDVTDPTAPSRQKAYRDRIKDRNATVTVERPHTETETHTQSEKKERTRASALNAPWVEADRERFWAEFPNKVGKADAMKALEKASHKTTPDVLFSALSRYANKTDDRPFCNPATWLNQERWLDQPAIATNGRRTVQQAADDLLAKLRAFDEPAPDGLCDREGEDVVRLLPSNRRG